MIALFGLFDLRQVRLQLLLAEERRAVHALHRLIARIAFPIRVRRVQQLERLQLAARRDVRAHTEIDEQVAILDRVDGHVLLALGLFLDELHLQRLAPLAEEPDRLVARPHLTLVDEVAAGNLLHLLLDGVEVFGHERPWNDEIVEEPLISWGAYAALHRGEELRHRGRQQMRRAVTIDGQGLRILVRENPDLRVLLQRMRQIDDAVVDHSGVRGLREARRYRRGDIADCCRARDAACRPVGEGDGELGQMEAGI